MPTCQVCLDSFNLEWFSSLAFIDLTSMEITYLKNVKVVSRGTSYLDSGSMSLAEVAQKRFVVLHCSPLIGAWVFSHYWWSNLEYLRWFLTAFLTIEFSLVHLTSFLWGDALGPCKHSIPLHPLVSASTGASCPTWLLVRWCRMVTFQSATPSRITWNFFFLWEDFFLV